MEHEAEIMEAAARGLFYETARALGMRDPFPCGETVMWFHDGGLYVMNSEEEYVGYYTRPDVVAGVMAQGGPEAIMPPIYRVIPVADIDGVSQEDGNTRLFFRSRGSPCSVLFFGLEAYDYFIRYVPARGQPDDP